jgi:hypothetical protein
MTEFSRMMYALRLKLPVASKVPRRYKGSFDCAAVRCANRNSAQDDKFCDGRDHWAGGL